MKQYQITIEISDHPLLGSGKLSGGYTYDLKDVGPGICFEYFNGSPKKIFLKCETNPSIKIIYDEVSDKQAQIRSLKKLKKPRVPFGWCNRCESYCYSDCQA